MTKPTRKRTRKPDVVVPAIGVSFEEAVSRLLRVKPPTKPAKPRNSKKR